MPSEMEIFQQDLLKSVKQMAAVKLRASHALKFHKPQKLAPGSVFRNSTLPVCSAFLLGLSTGLGTGSSKTNRSREDAPPRCVYSPRGAPRIKPVSTAV